MGRLLIKESMTRDRMGQDQRPKTRDRTKYRTSGKKRDRPPGQTGGKTRDQEIRRESKTRQDKRRQDNHETRNKRQETRQDLVKEAAQFLELHFCGLKCSVVRVRGQGSGQCG